MDNFKIDRSELFEFPKLKRVTGKNSRLYLTPDGEKLPSVTTILSELKKKEIMEWRRAVGEEEANRITRIASSLGTTVHNYLEKSLKGESFKRDKKKAFHYSLGDKILEHISSEGYRPVGVEVGIYYPSLYAGTADLLALDEKGFFVGDFKTINSLSDPVKVEKKLKSYRMQIVAYGEAFNYHYDLGIRRGKIFMIDRDGMFEEKEITEEMWSSVLEEWLVCLEMFYRKKKMI